MDFKDYYATLGVPKTATAKEIKQAFRKLARKHHPDVNPGDKAAESKFKELNEAYEVLGDAAKRKKYDELGSNWRMYEQAGPGPSPGGWSPGAGPFAGGSGTGGGYRTMTQEEMEEMFGSTNPFSDFFQTFFGGDIHAGDARGGRAGRKGPRKGRDFEDEIQLDLEDAYRGATRRLTIKQDGHARTVDVRIPAGVGDGSRVRIPGEGEHGTTGGQAGDLYLRIRMASHPRFERKGNDLYTRVTMSYTTAVLGGEVEVPALSGKPLRLRIPGTTQFGQVFRLRLHGMPIVGKPDERGDLYATADIQLPHELTPEERTHFEALKKLEDAKKRPAPKS